MRPQNKSGLGFFLFAGLLYFCLLPTQVYSARNFQVQSIDTMKYSRDAARELISKPQLRDKFKAQVADISGTGATHIAIGTPYDKEFLPVIRLWVNWAREYNLKVWFRGNWSGWENWFNYSDISPSDHLQKTLNFLNSNKYLFEDDDIFTPCPECENGGPGDPRFTVSVENFRKFLINHQRQCEEVFQKGPKVMCGYHSMNGDVAKLVMDKDTTARLGGVVVIDHYVNSPQSLDRYVNQIAEFSGGKVIIGEIGAPIPDIHGHMNEVQQALWVEESLYLMKNNPNVFGLNYWTSHGGSTSLWNTEGSSRLVVEKLTAFFKPPEINIKIVDELNVPVPLVLVVSGKVNELTDVNGAASLNADHEKFNIYHSNYSQKEISVSELKQSNIVEIELLEPSLMFKIQKFFKKLFSIN